MTGSWIWETNLAPFLEMLAMVARYDLTPEELEAIKNGTEGTDIEAGQWAEWQLAGAHAVTLHLAADAGTDVVHFQVAGPEDLEAAVALLGEVMCTYRLAR